jgi:hypothetical protein
MSTNQSANKVGHEGLDTASGVNPVQNERGQGVNYASDPNASKVPGKGQAKVQKSLEDTLPDKVSYSTPILSGSV